MQKDEEEEDDEEKGGKAPDHTEQEVGPPLLKPIFEDWQIYMTVNEGLTL